MSKKSNADSAGIKEIARRANVAIATVDRVIHNRVGVSEKTKAKINKIIAELNYQPNLFARRLASNNIIRLAILIPKSSTETSFWEAPLKGVEMAELEVSKFGMVIEKYLFDQNDRKSFLTQSRKLLASSPNGILHAPIFIEDSINFTEKCKEKSIPYVLIDSDLPNHGSLSYIGPDLFHSGYLNAHLVSYLINPSSKVLILNIAKSVESHDDLFRKEEGFRTYFLDKQIDAKIIRIDLNKTDNKSIEIELSKIFKKHKDISLIQVINSRVSNVAFCLEKMKKDILLIGYDFIPNNIEFLKKGVIDFLICQKPQEQAYRGIMSLYHHLILNSPVESRVLMPIDIITKENYLFYSN